MRLYYSFTTLTTVGYGDLDLSIESRPHAVNIEALLGQIYLITVVSLLVTTSVPAGGGTGALARSAGEGEHRG